MKVIWKMIPNTAYQNKYECTWFGERAQNWKLEETGSSSGSATYQLLFDLFESQFPPNKWDHNPSSHDYCIKEKSPRNVPINVAFQMLMSVIGIIIMFDKKRWFQHVNLHIH